MRRHEHGHDERKYLAVDRQPTDQRRNVCLQRACYQCGRQRCVFEYREHQRHARRQLDKNACVVAGAIPCRTTGDVLGDSRRRRWNTATGNVLFGDGSNVIPGCASAPGSNGVAQCITTSLPPGARAITAQYSGNTTYNAGISSIFVQTVLPSSLEAIFFLLLS